MFVMSLASWSQWWKSGRRLSAEKFFPRRENARFRDRRRLKMDALEARQLLAVTPVGGEFLVNSPATAGTFVQQLVPFEFESTRSVAVDHDGDFVVAWTSYGQDGSGGGIFARVFDRVGSPLTDEFQVNQFTL